MLRLFGPRSRLVNNKLLQIIAEPVSFCPMQTLHLLIEPVLRITDSIDQVLPCAEIIAPL